MGVFKPFISAYGETQSGVEPSERLLTPANAMTVARPALAIISARMLLAGARPVTPYVAAMAASDMEGKVAKFFDRHYPDLEIGTSKVGTEGDKIADTMAILIVGGAALLAPRVSRPAKLAIAGALGQEGIKTAWALRSQWEYAQAGGGTLMIPTSMKGKEAMAEKLGAVVAGTATNDFDNPLIRASLGVTALGFAATGAIRGEIVRQGYDDELDGMIADLHLLSSMMEAAEFAEAQE